MTRRFLTAEWKHLLMLNYEIDPKILEPIVPAGTVLDSWGGKVFVSMIGFLFLKTRVLGVPIPFHRNFPEVNLRFYVRREIDGEVRRGAVFIREIVPKFAIAAVARWVYNENYSACPMGSKVLLPDPARNVPGEVDYTWNYKKTDSRMAATFHGEPFLPTAGSQEEFITEHYWGYARQKDGSSMEYRVEHPQWKVWRADSSTFDCAVDVCYAPQYREALSRPPSSAFIADGSAVTVRRGTPMPKERP